MNELNDTPAWYLGFKDLELTLEKIQDSNARGLMKDYGTRTTPLLRPKENLARLSWYRELAFQLARLTAGWIATAAPVRLKMDLGRQAWLLTEFVAAMDARLGELPGLRGPVDPNGKLRELRKRMAKARNEEEFLLGVYNVVVSQLLLALAEHLTQCDPLADWPTRDRIERGSALLREQMQWARTVTEPYLAKADRAEVDRWCRYVADVFTACGGVRGETQGELPEHPFASQPLLDACAEPSRLEPGFNVTDAFMMAEPRVTAGALSDILFHNWGELIVPEGLGYMLFDVEGMPYEFYRDFIRQLWDECRHTEMGRRELERLGVDVKALPMNRLTRPPNYTEMLCIIGFTGEACSFPRKFESVEAFYKNDCYNAGLVTEYDIVDEHDHVYNIRKWLPKLHAHEKRPGTIEDSIKKVQSEALERWSQTRGKQVKDASRAQQNVGKFGAFCREVDFELNFNQVFVEQKPAAKPEVKG